MKQTKTKPQNRIAEPEKPKRDVREVLQKFMQDEQIGIEAQPQFVWSSERQRWEIACSVVVVDLETRKRQMQAAPGNGHG